MVQTNTTPPVTHWLDRIEKTTDSIIATRRQAIWDRLKSAVPMCWPLPEPKDLETDETAWRKALALICELTPAERVLLSYSETSLVESSPPDEKQAMADFVRGLDDFPGCQGQAYWNWFANHKRDHSVWHGGFLSDD